MAEGCSANSQASVLDDEEPTIDGADSDQSNVSPDPRLAESKKNKARYNIEEITTVNKYGMIELDIKKLEQKVLSLRLDETSKVHRQEKLNETEPLKDRLAKFYEDKSCSSKENRTEDLTELQEKNNPSEENQHTREESNEKDLENCMEGLSISIDPEEEANILKRIGYEKKGDETPKFLTRAFTGGEKKPDEEIRITVEQIELLHIPKSDDFLKQFKRKDFNNFAKDLEKNIEINNIFPSFKKFIESENKFSYPLECFTTILAILKNPCWNFDIFYNPKLPCVKNQKAIANYLITCLIQPNILSEKVLTKKLAETICAFADVHPTFFALILAGVSMLLSQQRNDEIDYQIYSEVLNIGNSIEGMLDSLGLPDYFERISDLAASDEIRELHFHLLKACVTLIAGALEDKSAQESDELEDKSVEESLTPEKMILFYSNCFNYFKSSFSTRLMPVFIKFEDNKNREEQYLARKHAIYPTAEGYMNTEMRLLYNKKKKFKPESSNFPRVKVSTCNSANKFFCSSNALLGNLDKNDKFLGDDLEYLNSLNNIPLSYSEGLNNILPMDIYSLHIIP